jgi:hypothetical protein
VIQYRGCFAIIPRWRGRSRRRPPALPRPRPPPCLISSLSFWFTCPPTRPGKSAAQQWRRVASPRVHRDEVMGRLGGSTASTDGDRRTVAAASCRSPRGEHEEAFRHGTRQATMPQPSPACCGGGCTAGSAAPRSTCASIYPFSFRRKILRGHETSRTRARAKRMYEKTKMDCVHFEQEMRRRVTMIRRRLGLLFCSEEESTLLPRSRRR